MTARTLAGDPVRTPTGSDEPAPLRLALVGFGRVARALARRLAAAHEAEARPPPFRVVAVFDSRGCVADPRGGALDELIRRKERTGRLAGPGATAWDLDTVLRELNPQVVVETTWSEPRPGEPGRRHLLSALLAGADVVTSNKGPLARHTAEVLETSRAMGRELRFGTTVGGIVPILESIRGPLRACGVTRIEGVVNGTTQYVLGRLADGDSYAQAVASAVQEGITEPDPRHDLDGHDAAMKAAILHNVLFAPPLDPARVLRRPVDASIQARARRLRDQGRRLVMLTEVTPGGAALRWAEVDRGDPWDLPAATNRFVVETERAGTLTFTGAGAGPEATAAGLLAELEEIAEGRERVRRSAPSPAGAATALRWGRPLAEPLP
jgi:homoserine dehydrogenase